MKNILGWIGFAAYTVGSLFLVPLVLMAGFAIPLGIVMGWTWIIVATLRFFHLNV